MEKDNQNNKKVDFGKIIRRLMAERDIKTAKQLAEEINRISIKEIGKKVITANSVGKWLRAPGKGASEPKATSLMYLIKALNVSADFILSGDLDSPHQRKSLERMVSKIVSIEIQKSLKNTETQIQDEVVEFLKSDKIPQEDKDLIVARMKRLLKMYKEVE